MPKWKLLIEYEGTRYRGWQEQKNARTIQGELRKAAREFSERDVEIIGAGRTDAGVHALCQTAHLQMPMKIKPALLRQEINDRLPSDICIREIVEVPSGFHARYSAEERFYLYQIATQRTAFAKRFVWWIKDRLDPAIMANAAKIFVGRHDFSCFCDKSDEKASTIVEVTGVDLQAHGELILFRISASHFLWKMVRRIVGVIVEIGRGNLRLQDMRALSAAEIARVTAPPSGLFLECVRYKGEKSPGPLVPAISVRSNATNSSPGKMS